MRLKQTCGIDSYINQFHKYPIIRNIPSLSMDTFVVNIKIDIHHDEGYLFSFNHTVSLFVQASSEPNVVNRNG